MLQRYKYACFDSQDAFSFLYDVKQTTPYVETRSSARPSVYYLVSATKPLDGVLQNVAQAS